MNKEAKNMEAIYKAKQDHDVNCPYGGQAIRIYMTYFDIGRMGWEEGDNIAGMTLHGDPKLQTGRMRIECDAEPNSGDDPMVTQKVEDEDLVTA